MSIITTKPLQIAPSAAAYLAVASAAGTWSNPGSYVEFIASTSGAIQVAGLLINNPSAGQVTAEFDIATGTAGNEVVQATVTVQDDGTSGMVTPYLFPTPIDRFPNASRITVRARGNAGIITWGVKLLYYTAFDGGMTDLIAKVLPSNANSGALTPSGSDWGNSAYVQLTAGISNQISIYNLGIKCPWTNVFLELDLAFGAAAAEVVQTTVRGISTANEGLLKLFNLIAPFPVPANTRVAVRLRKSGTSVTTSLVTANYYDATTFPTSGATGKSGNKGNKGGTGVNIVEAGGTGILNIGNTVIIEAN